MILLQERAPGLLVAIFAYADHYNLVLVGSFVNILKRREREFAGFAPGRPEINDDYLSAQIFGRNVFAFSRCESELRRAFFACANRTLHIFLGVLRFRAVR